MRRPSFSFFPSWGIHLPPPLPLQRRDGYWSLRILCPKHHDDEGRSWSPWPLYGPLSLAPRKAPGPTYSSEVVRLVLLAAGLDRVSDPASSCIPNIIVGSALGHLPRDMTMKHMDGQIIMTTYRTCRAGQLVPAVRGGVRPRFAGIRKHLPDILV